MSRPPPPCSPRPEASEPPGRAGSSRQRLREPVEGAVFSRGRELACCLGPASSQVTSQAGCERRAVGCHTGTTLKPSTVTDVKQQRVSRSGREVSALEGWALSTDVSASRDTCYARCHRPTGRHSPSQDAQDQRWGRPWPRAEQSSPPRGTLGAPSSARRGPRPGPAAAAATLSPGTWVSGTSALGRPRASGVQEPSPGRRSQLWVRPPALRGLRVLPAPSLWLQSPTVRSHVCKLRA